MYSMFDSLKKHLRKDSGVDGTTFLFKLVCRYNALLLCAFAVILSAKQFVGDPIDCYTSTSNSKILEIMNNFCWIMGTYIDADVLNKINPGAIAPGVGTNNANGEKIYQRQYQWVVFIYMLLAAFYAFPNWLWKTWGDGGRLKALCSGLTSPLMTKEWNEGSRQNLLQYLVEPTNVRFHRCYVIKFFFCETLIFLSTLFGIYLVAAIFPGFWWDYGYAIEALVSSNYTAWSIHSSKHFPKLAKCDYVYYGPSGSAQLVNSLCLLTLNIVNEKIFAFIYVWFLVLFAVAALDLIRAIIVAFSLNTRLRVLQNQAPRLSLEQIEQASSGACWGDWFILHLLGRNLNPYMFEELLLDLCDLRGGKRKELGFEAGVFKTSHV